MEEHLFATIAGALGSKPKLEYDPSLSENPNATASKPIPLEDVERTCAEMTEDFRILAKRHVCKAFRVYFEVDETQSTVRVLHAESPESLEWKKASGFMVKALTNELGNRIYIRVYEKSERDVKIRMLGPTSESTNTLTKLEASYLMKTLLEFLEQDQLYENKQVL